MDWAITLLACVITFVGTVIVEEKRHQHNQQYKYWETQFDFYSKLYPSLIELRNVADRLWEHAAHRELLYFIESLKRTEKDVEKNVILIDEPDHQELQQIFKEFWRFEVGKSQLIELRDRDINSVPIHAIEFLVRTNGETKDKYTQLIAKLNSKFKAKLKGEKLKRN